MVSSDDSSSLQVVVLSSLLLSHLIINLFSQKKITFLFTNFPLLLLLICLLQKATTWLRYSKQMCWRT